MNMDVLLILVHHLHVFAYTLPHSIQVMMEGYSGSNTVIDVNEVAQKA